MLEGLKIEVYKANQELAKNGLVTLRWGNISARDERTGYIVIKPRRIAFTQIKPDDLIVCDMEGKILEGSHTPSSDLFTHLEIYKAFPQVGSVAHTHSKWATVFAQAGESIPNLGTTHADYFKYDIPVTRTMRPEEIAKDYEKNTGRIIADAFTLKDPMTTPAILVKNHGPFVWGRDIADAVDNAVALEYVAEMAFYTLRLNTDADMNKYLIEKHVQRKQGGKNEQ
ncbi:L-ribulose-5-phosphate 4-epimerase AraD [Christensenella tenuis]|uniref:L-ribulose-5-phosphate 4-epimerase n=1 Tax=Christensenella tenuis TaxID=2763033 RepID=A0ABR7EHQ7_9FIRM|nr:L-ribulose-5-phosphate 4-epimerase AraD [Christensenella tenuis]MBC5649307.1 L-ribulose-5-phosphate 4-epimerase AraD [Christensenella tenuis]